MTLIKIKIHYGIMTIRQLLPVRGVKIINEKKDTHLAIFGGIA
jgi:hypothetical protein